MVSKPLTTLSQELKCVTKKKRKTELKDRNFYLLRTHLLRSIFVTICNCRQRWNSQNLTNICFICMVRLPESKDVWIDSENSPRNRKQFLDGNNRLFHEALWNLEGKQANGYCKGKPSQGHKCPFQRLVHPSQATASLCILSILNEMSTVSDNKSSLLHQEIVLTIQE